MAAAVLLEIFPIIYCKYADFFIQNLNVLTGQKIPLLSIAMPLGISFYTFQVISYTVDVYRGDVPAQKNLLTFAAYVAMFPQLVAGPIVRYSDIRSQLENRMHSVEKHYRILAQMAYFTWRMVPGLSLHPAGRQSCKTCAVDLQYFSCVDGNRILAWGGMEFYPVGTNVCGAFTD